MTATARWLAALAAAAFLAPAASAQCCYVWPPRAPDMCGPGYYTANYWGQVYGPNHYVRPPFPPFQGMIMPPGGGGGGGMGSPLFPTHPWARSPRDYFMVDVEGREDPYRSLYGPNGRFGAGIGTGIGTAISDTALPGGTTGVPGP